VDVSLNAIAEIDDVEVMSEQLRDCPQSIGRVEYFKQALALRDGEIWGEGGDIGKPSRI
jgi:hypothetical protein